MNLQANRFYRGRGEWDVELHNERAVPAREAKRRGSECKRVFTKNWCLSVSVDAAVNVDAVGKEGVLEDEDADEGEERENQVEIKFGLFTIQTSA